MKLVCFFCGVAWSTFLFIMGCWCYTHSDIFSVGLIALIPAFGLTIVAAEL